MPYVLSCVDPPLHQAVEVVVVYVKVEVISAVSATEEEPTKQAPYYAVSIV
jgi:hypothetical protein